MPRGSAYGFALAVTAFAAALGQQRPVTVPARSLRGYNVPIVSLSLGTAGPRLAVLDTGSPLLWLPAATKASVTTPAAQATPCPADLAFIPPADAPVTATGITFAYGGGYIEGPGYNLTLSLAEVGGGVWATDDVQAVSATTVGLGCDVGILGVDQSSVTLPRVFAAHGLPSILTVNLACPAVPAVRGQLGSAGNVTFGGVGTAQLGGRALQSVPLLPVEHRIRAQGRNPQGEVPTFTRWWQFGLTSVAVGDVVTDRAGGASGELQGIADTGTSMIMAGPGNGFTSLCGVARDCSNFSALQPLTFSLAGGATATLTPADYVIRDSPTSCVSQVHTLDDIPAGFVVLGDPFFWKHTVVFDSANGGQVRFAEREVSGACSSPDTPTSGGSHGGSHGSEKPSAGDDVGMTVGALAVIAIVAVIGMYIYRSKEAARHSAGFFGGDEV